MKITNKLLAKAGIVPICQNNYTKATSSIDYMAQMSHMENWVCFYHKKFLEPMLVAWCLLCVCNCLILWLFLSLGSFPSFMLDEMVKCLQKEKAHGN